MWTWHGCWYSWAWHHGYRMPAWSPYEGYGYGYPWGAVPKEEEIAMLEEQERWLTSELDGVRKRLEEFRK
jgi:hypothetical protein